MKFGGIILCGGMSSRMGKPKAWLTLGNETFLQRMVRTLTEVVSPVVVVTARGQEIPHLPKETLVTIDEFPEEGPLRGIAGGMAALKGMCDAAFVTSCDAPFLKVEFIRLLKDKMAGHSWCVPVAGGFTHPLAGIYKLDLLSVAESLLAAKRNRPVFLLEAAAGLKVMEEELREVDEELISLWNINIPSDYAAAVKKFQKKNLSQEKEAH